MVSETKVGGIPCPYVFFSSFYWAIFVTGNPYQIATKPRRESVKASDSICANILDLKVACENDLMPLDIVRDPLLGICSTE